MRIRVPQCYIGLRSYRIFSLLYCLGRDQEGMLSYQMEESKVRTGRGGRGSWPVLLTDSSRPRWGQGATVLQGGRNWAPDTDVWLCICSVTILV
jgi:hypothetical protein